jgi:hypothetical protein
MLNGTKLPGIILSGSYKICLRTCYRLVTRSAYRPCAASRPRATATHNVKLSRPTEGT